MSNAPQPSSQSECPSCHAAMQSDAKFCQNCGAPVGGQPAAKPRNWKFISLFALGAIVMSFGLTFMIGNFVTEKGREEKPPAFDVATSSMTRPQPPDLSTMSPREAADRLFNRVMMADSRGDSAEANRFAPMALQAYLRIGRLNSDAYYHMGLINLLIGNLDQARSQANSIIQNDPNHLLGLVLFIKLAMQADDQMGASSARAKFDAAYKIEIKSGKPEYEAHGKTIEKFQISARGVSKAGLSGEGPKKSDAGARYFAAKCAGCHGREGVGSNQGPPLVHKIYEPNHHGDAAFHRAVRLGVKSHHWAFGNMPPVLGVTDGQISQIVAYVRALQSRKGIIK